MNKLLTSNFCFVPEGAVQTFVIKRQKSTYSGPSRLIFPASTMSEE